MHVNKISLEVKEVQKGNGVLGKGDDGFVSPSRRSQRHEGVPQRLHQRSFIVLVIVHLGNSVLLLIFGSTKKILLLGVRVKTRGQGFPLAK